ncbi:MAG: ATP-binding protein [Oscillospiraceae bacterium]
MDIITGKIQKAKKVVIYGPEGIGKSTFASHFPNPVFIDTEGSTNGMNISRTPKPTSWEMLNNFVRELMVDKQFQTIVVDTIDWAEQLCINSVCSKYNKNGIEDFGYGNGYVYEKEEFGRFLNLLQDVVDSGINVVLTAHAQIKKFEQPDEMGAYDRWELKLGKKTASQISPLVKEWADMILFANYKTYAVSKDDNGKKFKAQGGERVMYTSHHPCWDAKNRDDLPPEMPFDYSGIAHLFNTRQQNNVPVIANSKPEKSPPAEPNPAENHTPEEWEEALNIPNDIPQALQDLMRADKVSDMELREVVSQQGYCPLEMPISKYPVDFINGALIADWQTVVAKVKKLNINGVPF